jgi:hypothetical protein
MKSIKPIIVIGILLGFSLFSCDPPTEAETTGVIEGIIYDASSSEPLSGVTLTTEPTTSSKITDSNGSFKIEGVEPGDYSLQAAKTGFVTNSTTVHVVADETASADMQLTPVAPELSVSVTSLDFGSTSTSLPFTIMNTGEGTLTWSVSENSNWMSVNPGNGSVSDNQSSVTISVDRSNLDPGDYSETVTVTSDGGSATVQVSMTVEGPVLVLSNNSLNFGTITENLSFTVTNAGIGTITYNAVYSATWLTVNPASGSATTETDVINVSVNRAGLSYGNHFETITVTSNANSVTVDVMITVSDPNNPQISAYPTSLDFEENSTQETFYVTNTGSGMLTWNITDDKSWISANPQSGTTEGETDEIVITIDRLGQGPGTYTGIVNVTSDGGNQNINVSMSVPDEPALSVSPSSLDFGTETNSMSFDVANAGTGDVNWSASDNQEWITISPASGTNYGTVNVTIDRSGLSPGDYSGTVTISSNAGTGYVEVLLNMPADEPPAAVTLIDPTEITVNSMLLSWSRNYDSDFAAYQLYYDTSPAVSENSTLATTITDNNINSFTVTGLIASATYYFKVYVMDTAQQTVGSNVVTAPTSSILGTWMLTNNIANVHFNAVWFNSENDGYAVGYRYALGGRIYHWGGSSWVEETIPDITGELMDVRFIDVNNGYAVSSRGEVLYYNGTSWSEIESPVNTNVSGNSIRAVVPFSSDNIWCIEDNDIYHWDGSTWSLTSLDIDFIHDIYFINENDGWVVDSDGIMYHYNGIGWGLHSDVAVTYNNGVGRLVFLHASEGWYVSREYSYHFNGTNWNLYENTEYPFSDVNNMQELSASNIWAVGRGGDIYNYDGSRWNSLTSPTTSTLNDVFMVSENDGWAVGNDGVILRYN